MKILNISANDWANFAYENMKALRSVGLECDSVVTTKHAFYTEQSECLHTIQIAKLIKEYDVIQFFHDNTNLFVILLPELKKKKVIAYHTSSYYRKNHATVNEIMNPFVYKCVNAMPEFMGMGAKNDIYMVGAVDTDKIKQQYDGAGFAHYPSNSKVKGTDEILRIFKQLEVQIDCSTDLRPYKDQLRRISKCRIYVGMFT